MKKKFIFLMAVMVCLLCLSACVNSGADSVGDDSVSIEDTEDIEIVYGSVNLVNLMGKDAVELYARPAGTTEWSGTIISESSLKTNVEVAITYAKTEKNIFDLRLVFADGTAQEFTNINFTTTPTIYLGLEK